MRGIRIVMGLVGVFGLAANAAADPAWYVGGGVGQYNIKIDGNPSGFGGTPEFGSDRNFQDSAAVWDVLAGYQFNKYLAIQADYNWYSKTQTEIPINSSTNVQATAESYEVSVRPSLPLGHMFEVYARIGYNWYNLDIKRQYVKGESDSNDAVMYAGGVGVHLSDNFSLNAEYEIVDVNSGDLNSATLRAVYRIPR